MYEPSIEQRCYWVAKTQTSGDTRGSLQIELCPAGRKFCELNFCSAKDFDDQWQTLPTLFKTDLIIQVYSLYVNTKRSLDKNSCTRGVQVLIIN